MKLLDRLPAENARTYVIRVLLQNIMSLELIPGSAVSENELSLIMNTSRTPVREALIELSKMGLVEIIPQKGSYISKIDYDLIEESRFMRLVMEKEILKLACNGISKEFLNSLDKNMELQRKYINKLDSTEFLQLDNEFHKLIFQSVGKTWTYEIIHTQMIHFDRLRALSLKTIEPVKTVRDHENILYTIKHHDSELAEMIITKHLTRHQVEKSELIKLYPNYFVISPNKS